MKIHNRGTDQGAMPTVQAEGKERLIRRLGNHAVAVEIEEPVRELVLVEDDAGEPVYRPGPNNSKRREKRWAYKRDENGNVVKVTKRYAKIGDHRGFVRKVPNFEPTAAEIARNERQARVDALNENLASELEAAGVSPSELIAAVRALREGDGGDGGELVEGDENALDSAAEGPFDGWPKHKGGPWFVCSDDEQIKGKEAAHAHEASLREEADPALA